MLEGVGDVAVVPTRLQHETVGSCQLGAFGELLAQPLEGAFERPVEHPIHHAEGEEVLAAITVSRRKLGIRQRLPRQFRERHPKVLIAAERRVFERIRFVLRLLVVARVELVGVEDDDPAPLEHRQVGLKRGGVHRHENLRGVAGRVDVVVGDPHLEGRHPRQGAGGRADLGRKLGQGRQVVAHQGRGIRELGPGQLHAVAAIPRETDDDIRQLLRRCVGHGRWTGWGGKNGHPRWALSRAAARWVHGRKRPAGAENFSKRHVPPGFRRGERRDGPSGGGPLRAGGPVDCSRTSSPNQATPIRQPQSGSLSQAAPAARSGCPTCSWAWYELRTSGPDSQ